MFETLIPAAAGLLGGMGGGSQAAAPAPSATANGGAGGVNFNGGSIFGNTYGVSTGAAGGSGGSAAQGGNAGAVSQTSWLTLAAVGLAAGALVGLVFWLINRK